MKAYLHGISDLHSHPNLLRLASIEGVRIVLSKEHKTKIMQDNRLSPEDTGSPEVQVALLSERINSLTNHLITHKKDFTSRVGLMKLVGQRKRLLAYLRREDQTRYEQLIQKLKLRK
jgi:small subunit ribosomal protein S15